MKNILKSKKGEATYIYLCALILVISMLLSVLILYMGRETKHIWNRMSLPVLTG